MHHPKTGKKVMKAAFPEVEAFAAYLAELIQMRTSENKLFRAAGVGNSKLSKYLDGTDVPDGRVLEYYILRPLSRFCALSDGEYTTLMDLHGNACLVQQPREPTDTDQINFLEEDLAQAQSKVEDLTERLNSALRRNSADTEQIAQLKLNRDDLRAQLRMLTDQARALQQELEKSRQECQETRNGTSHKLAEFTEHKRRELDACQQKISSLEVAVAGYANTSAELRRHVGLLNEKVRALKQDNSALQQENTDLKRHNSALQPENTDLKRHNSDLKRHNSDLKLQIRGLKNEVSEQQARNADERRLFLALVNHAAKGEVLARLSRRHERGEKTIADLTEANKTLTETNKTLTTELDRVSQERDFLRAAAGPRPQNERIAFPSPADEEFWLPRRSPRND